MRRLKLGLVSTVAMVGCLGAAETANAQFIFGGGSTLASTVYRQLFDCYYYPANTSIMPVVSGCGTGDASGVVAQILYAPVGSGAGLKGFTTENPANFGTPAASNTVPYTSQYFTSYPYSSVHFGASDATLSAANVATFNANSNAGTWGPIIQIPAFATAIAIPFNGKDGNGNPLNIANATPAGGSSGLNLSRQAVCGIFSGHITQWNDPILTATNGGVQLGTGKITVVHRTDNSGTTFLTTQALIAQCSGQIGPTSTGAATFSTYAFPWTDRAAGGTTGCGGGSDAIPIEATQGANWPDLTTDQCGVAIPNTGGATFANASGSGGVVGLIASTNGAIGYVSPDFVLPAKVGGVAAANLQSQYDIDNSTGLFYPPTPIGAYTAMSAAVPNFTAATYQNPLNWSDLGVIANPVSPGAYPIAGFTWLNFYSCYAPASFSNILGYLGWHYQNPGAQTILENAGFAPIPANWFSAVGQLVLSTMHQGAGCN